MLEHGHEFDLIHASPPCQAYSALRHLHKKVYPDLVGPTRDALRQVGKPYVIENVPGSPLIDPVMMCGSMFGIGSGDRILKRHRLFETTFVVPQPVDKCRGHKIGGVYGYGGGGLMKNGSYKFHLSERREAMGIDWMTGMEIAQAIPPAYTHYIAAYAPV